MFELKKNTITSCEAAITTIRMQTSANNDPVSIQKNKKTEISLKLENFS